MLLAALLPAALLTVALSTPARACSPDFAHVLWTRPAGGATDVPRDVVLRVLAGGGDSVADDFDLALFRGDNQISLSVARESWQGSSLADSRLLFSLSPDEPLVAGATYRLEVVHTQGGEGYGAQAAFTVADVQAAAIEGVPDVRVVSATDTTGDGAAACDWDEVRTFLLDVEPAQPDPDNLGIMAVYRTKALDDTWHLVHVFGVDGGGTPRDLSLRGDRLRDWGSCFVAVQRGGGGAKSEVSELGCAPEPLQPEGEGGDDSGGRPPDHADEDSSCRGCDAGAGGAGAISLLLAGLLGLRRRG